jgi:hypothetical protein
MASHDVETMAITKMEIKEGTGVVQQAEIPLEQSATGKAWPESLGFGPITGGPDGWVPTRKELEILRRVPDKFSWRIITIAFIEMCERFSFYGTVSVFTNFIQHPLPKGSTTGAAPGGQPGAMGLGQRASTGITTFSQFW